MRLRFLLASTVGLAALVASQRSHADEDVAIVIDPRTGAAEIRNDSDTPIDLDGYLLRASSNLFDPVAWNSLEEQAVPGWVDGPSAANRLADTNLFGSSTLAPGATFDLGSPYTPFAPSAIGEFEPSFDFTYSVPGFGAFEGDIEFSRANNVVLVIDPSTGDSSLVNQSAFDIDIDAYLITSSLGVLDADGWAPIAGSDSEWTAASGRATVLAEGNLFDATALSSDGGSLSIGSAINTELLDDETDLTLQYNIPGVGQLTGSVLFASAATTLFGDFEPDGDVDIIDFGAFADAFGSVSGDPNYDIFADSEPDGDVDIIDFGLFADNFGIGTATATAVPEPTSVVLVIALGSLLGTRRR